MLNIVNKNKYFTLHNLTGGGVVSYIAHSYSINLSNNKEINTKVK